MVEVRLHGVLAKEFGKVWNLEVATPREAARAIQCTKNKFFERIQELDRLGMVFIFRTSCHEYDTSEIDMSMGSVKRLDIIPIVRGASAAVRFVVGAILTVVGIFTHDPLLVKVGVALMLGSVAEWLAPKPKRQDFQQGAKSWTLNGPTNTVEQGQPVPVIYGEVLTGGYPISAGLAAAQLTAAGSIDPAVKIGGNTDVSIVHPTTSRSSPSTPTKRTAATTLSVALLNLQDPATYTWTVGTVSGVVAQRVIGQGTSSIRIEWDYMSDTEPSGSITVSVSVTATYTQGGTTETRTASDSVTVKFKTRAIGLAGLLG